MIESISTLFKCFLVKLYKFFAVLNRNKNITDFSDSELKEMKQYEAEVKSYIYEGVSVQRIISGASGKGQYCLEIRTLWLMLPEVGSLRLGFLSKETDGGIGVDESDVYSRGKSHTSGSTMSNDDDGSTVSSTDVSLLKISFSAFVNPVNCRSHSTSALFCSGAIMLKAIYQRNFL